MYKLQTVYCDYNLERHMSERSQGTRGMVSVVTAPFTMELHYVVPDMDVDSVHHYVRYGILHCEMPDGSHREFRPFNEFPGTDFKHPDEEPSVQVMSTSQFERAYRAEVREPTSATTTQPGQKMKH